MTHENCNPSLVQACSACQNTNQFIASMIDSVPMLNDLLGKAIAFHEGWSPQRYDTASDDEVDDLVMHAPPCVMYILLLAYAVWQQDRVNLLLKRVQALQN